MSRILSLDLDETLISSVRTPIIERKPDFEIRPYVVYKRPYLNKFLDWAYGTFDQVGVYTTATKNYADAVIYNVFGGRPLAFRLSREDCIEYDLDSGQPYSMGSNKEYIKDVLKILHDSESTLQDLYIVDDKLEVYHPLVARSGNLVVARRFTIHTYRNTDEDGLLTVQQQLENLLASRN